VRPLLSSRLLVSAAVLLSAAACSNKDAKAPRQRPPPSVTAAAVTVRDVPVEVRAPVDLRPLAQAEVGAKAIGYLDAVLVDRGDRVRRGQLVAVVRPSDLPDQIASARSVLAQQQAAVALARANRERAERLAPSGVVSEQELQQARTALDGAEAALASSQANVGALATRLGETRITAPLDGVVSQRRLDPGALVGPTSGSSTILTVERDDVFRVFIPVNERDVAALRVGQDAHVEFDALPGKTYAGKVVRVSPAFDPAARTLDAEVHVRNPGELRSGMYGRAAIVTAIHPGAVVVQAGAVQVSGDERVVFVLQGERVKRTRVEVGVDGGDWLEIVRGLAPGDEIVTAGTDALSDGAQVRAQKNVDPYTGASALASGGRDRRGPDQSERGGGLRPPTGGAEGGASDRPGGPAGPPSMKSAQ
jgi:RND family efflux transporter MFP subunit